MPLLSDHSLLNFQQRIDRLRALTLVFFVFLFAPVAILLYSSFLELEQKALSQYQAQSSKITDSINKRLFKRSVYYNAITSGEFDHYQYFYHPDEKTVSRVVSPLANTEDYGELYGLIGYFQIDQNGAFNSPVWPYELGSAEDAAASQQELATEQHEQRALANRLQSITMRSEQLRSLSQQKPFQPNSRFKLVTDVPEYLMYYRNVMTNGELKLQGFVLDSKAHLDRYVTRVLGMYNLAYPLVLEVLSRHKNIPPRYFLSQPDQQGEMQVSQPPQVPSELIQLYIGKRELKLPFDDHVIKFSTSAVGLSTTSMYAIALMLALLLAIAIGCYGFYRLGVKQLKLAEQRLNFVSAISHELKTPLTSIRMYSEMLRQKQVLSEQHQFEYYDFIYTESERLSRLIDNILQLTRLSQPQQSVTPEYVKLSVLMDQIRSKVSSLMVKNDFQLSIEQNLGEADQVLLLVDLDAFAQVVINITDNAIKFFDKQSIEDVNRQKVLFEFQPDPKHKGQVQLTIRDYGLGITSEQESKIFELFYRAGSELTRTAQGTGIGLALVNDLMLAQQGSVRVERMNPGLALHMSFKSKIER